MNDDALIKKIDQSDYQTIWQQMMDFTQNRVSNTPDEIWLVEHDPVFTQGQAGRPEHVLNPGDIPVVQTDRGGQVTYHGPGQLVVYPLIDLRRAKIGIKQYVGILEQTTIQLLAGYNIAAEIRDGAPGVYVKDAKICSIGLRVRRGCSYHGLALNVDMDLEPFSRINPCGFRKLAMTQIKDFVNDIRISEVENKISKYLVENIYDRKTKTTT
ncbi:MAG: lipoyl(octanoyl) transferase LipB [Gammaproteobacteria bacterium]|jgi:lipoyl(octanoyl) transferase